MDILDIKEEVFNDREASSSDLKTQSESSEIFSTNIDYANPTNNTKYFNQLHLTVEKKVQKWKYDFIKGKETHPLAIEIRDKPNPKIDVGLELSGKIYASIECVLCNKFIRLYVNNSQWSEGIITVKNQNYTRHLKAHFKE